MSNALGSIDVVTSTVQSRIHLHQVAAFRALNRLSDGARGSNSLQPLLHGRLVVGTGLFYYNGITVYTVANNFESLNGTPTLRDEDFGVPL